MKKLTIEEARVYFEKAGLVLLEDSYINNSTKMKYQCKAHMDNVQEITLANLKSGRGCKYCSIESRSHKRRKNKEDILKLVSERNCIVLNIEEYKNIQSLLTFQCDKGHIFNKTLYSFLKADNICKECAGILPLTDELVRNYIKNENYILLDSFLDYDTKIHIECDNGHKYFTKWSRFQQGARCPKCAGNKKYAFEEVVKIFDDSNCKLLSDSYVNNKQKLDYICECESKSQITLQNFLEGHRCEKCRRKKANENRLKTLYENGTSPTSKPQKYIHDILGGELNLLEDRYFLDIAFIEEKIYIEYDGGGHWLKVENGDIAEQEFNRNEFLRSKKLRELGWKELRIISRQDYVPNADSIISIYKLAKDYLKNHSWIKFDIDQGIVYGSSINKPYNFNNLFRFR